jgi:hypothetical protein
MSIFVHLLEPRRLFSMTAAILAADAAQVIAEAKSVQSILVAGRATDAADRKAVFAELGRPVGKDNTKLVSALSRDDASAWAKTLAAENALLAKGNALAHRAAADGTLLLKRPGNAALQARVSADEAALANEFPSLISAVNDQYLALDRARNADLGNLLAANPSSPTLPGAVQTAESDSAATNGKLGGTTTLLQILVNNLSADLTSLNT